jgi:hypothetical protein
MIGSRRRHRRQPTFDAPLDVVEADVAHHEDVYSPTEVIAEVPEGPTETLFLDPLPEDAEAEVAPEPEPEPLPHAGYAIGPQILTEYKEWRYLFPLPPATEDEVGEPDAEEQGPEPLFPQPYPISDSQVIAIYGGADA